MNKTIKIIFKKIIPKGIYLYLRKLRINLQFKYLNLMYGGKKSTYNYKGYNFIVRNGTDDDAIVREVIDGDYNIDDEKYNTLVDIGAHIGTYSVLMANRSDKVYSFEPNPESFELLKENIKNANVNNLFIYPLAIANTKRTEKLFINPYSTGACGIYEDKSTKSIEIKCITLKDFMYKENLEKIDLLKMDCEGAEYEIITSLSINDLSKIKRIVMEAHQYGNLKNPIWMKNYLENKGYEVSEKINKLNGNSYLFAEQNEK